MLKNVPGSRLLRKWEACSIVTGTVALACASVGYLWAAPTLLAWDPGLAGPRGDWKTWYTPGLLILLFSMWVISGLLALWFGMRSYRQEDRGGPAILGIILGLVAIVALGCWGLLALWILWLL